MQGNAVPPTADLWLKAPTVTMLEKDTGSSTAGPNQCRAGADHPRTSRSGGHGEKALSRCKWGPERALLVVKGRIGWHKRRNRLERARNGPMQMKTA